MKPWMLVFVTLAGCAAFDQQVTLYAPSKMCIGMCAHLEPATKELDSPEMTARLCALGAMTKDCKR